MYKTILLPTDGSPISRKAVKQGIAFAKAIGAKVVGFYSPQDYRTAMYGEYVPPALYVSQAEFAAAAKETAQKQLAWIERAAADAGVRYEGVYKVSYAPWEVIIETAKKKKCDLDNGNKNQHFCNGKSIKVCFGFIAGYIFTNRKLYKYGANRSKYCQDHCQRN